jgi:hypothetical protein
VERIVSDTLSDSDDAGARQGGEPSLQHYARSGTTVSDLSDAELSRMVDAVTARDKEFFRLRRRRKFRVRKASVFEVEHFGRRSSLNYDELPPGGWSWHVVVYRIHANLRLRVPFVAQSRTIVEAGDVEAHAIYEIVCSKRWKELAEQAKERGMS